MIPKRKSATSLQKKTGFLFTCQVEISQGATEEENGFFRFYFDEKAEIKTFSSVLGKKGPKVHKICIYKEMHFFYATVLEFTNVFATVLQSCTLHALLPKSRHSLFF